MIWNPFFPPLLPFHDFVQGVALGGPARFPSIRAESTETSVLVEALLPGVDPDGLQLDVEDDELILAGEIQPLGEMEPVRRERPIGRFRRRLRMPFPVDQASAKAEFKDGVLRVELERKNATGPISITIKSPGDTQ